MRATVMLLVGVSLGAAATPARAHHGDADRYSPEVFTITGTVVELRMVTPPARTVLEVEDGGRTVRWQAELGGPQQLIKQFP